MGMAAPIYYTADMVRALPDDGNRYEVVSEVWSPSDTFPRFEQERLVWHPAGAGEAFTLPLGELFRPV